MCLLWCVLEAFVRNGDRVRVEKFSLSEINVDQGTVAKKKKSFAWVFVYSAVENLGLLVWITLQHVISKFPVGSLIVCIFISFNLISYLYKLTFIHSFF